MRIHVTQYPAIQPFILKQDKLVSMNARRRVQLAGKACARCRSQKRRCDRATPQCGLCRRLRQACHYEGQVVSSPSSTPSSPLDAELHLGVLNSGHIKDAIAMKLTSAPSDIFATYIQSIHPWFPIIALTLQDQLPKSWNEASLDYTLLALCISLLCTSPPPSSGDGTLSGLQSTYLHIKSWIAVIEGLGITSLKIVQARTLVTLFEVAHGFYPAAYISIGTTVRAADALKLHDYSPPSSSLPTNEESAREEAVLVGCAIRILDRYITVQSGHRPLLTCSTLKGIYDPNKGPWPTGIDKDTGNPLWQLSRLFEASTLLDNIHNALKNPTSERTFNTEEIRLLVETSYTLRTLLIEEVEDADQIYSGGLGLCQTGILLAYENGTKVQITDAQTLTCQTLATSSINPLLTNITDMVHPFVNGAQVLDLDRFPPFITFLVYKAARIVTERIWMETDTNEALRKLRILREFLQMVNARWLCCEYYLGLLNEDTAPRILKSIEGR
ncbi:transcriptional regulator family: Fungal Specific TF [Aspergillus niger]|nr:transcriptional regulator family: Fungal Specific TF [Aspergillus niger]KAI3030872.1 transcriptional regulator family: Fungal Specific TF [Aspergillus niger]KAI3082302.1 transcriptional regulator family: Fungal Specific TF [Aspergillus niger]